MFETGEGGLVTVGEPGFSLSFDTCDDLDRSFAVKYPQGVLFLGIFFGGKLWCGKPPANQETLK